MTKDAAILSARLLVQATQKTACVFVRPGRGKKPADYVSGSAYEPKPKGYKLKVYISVTGLERSVDGSDAEGKQ